MKRIILAGAVAIYVALGSMGIARADCPAAPIADPDDLVISFLALNGTQAAPGSVMPSTVKEGMVVYDDANDVLKMCDGTNWVEVGSGGGSLTLAGLTDVDVTGVSTGQVLSWDGTNWVPVTFQGPPVMIPQGDGTNIGNMTSNGGLAAAFDGNTSQTDVQSAYRSPVLGSWVGKQYATAQNVTQWKAWGSSDYGFHNANANGSGTWSLQYKDTDCTNDASWTTADSVAVTTNAQTIDRSFTSVGSHLCWRIRATSGGGGGDARTAELQFYVPGALAGSDTLASLSCTNGEIAKFDGTDWVCAADGGGGGGGATSSMVTGWPDAIICSGTAGTSLFDFAWSNAAGAGNYTLRGDYGDTSNSPKLSFSSISAAATLTETATWPNWATSCSGKTITQLYTDGKAFNFIGGGSGSGGYTGRGMRSTTYSPAAINTWYDLPFEASAVLSGVTHSTSTNPERMTVTNAGKYLLTFSVIGSYAYVGSSTTYARVTVNGTAVGGAYAQSGTTNGLSELLASSAVVSLNAGDYVTLQVMTNGAGNTFSSGTLNISAIGGGDTLGGLSCSTNEIPKWNGTAWACAADGGGGGSTQGPYLRLTYNAGTLDRANVIPFNVSETGGGASWSANKFTASQAGLYLATVEGYANGSSYVSFQIRKNGVGIVASFGDAGATNKPGGAGVTIVTYLNAGDYLDFYYNHDTPSIYLNSATASIAYLGANAPSGGGSSGQLVAFRAHKGGTAQAVASSTSTKLTFSTESFDTNNNFDTTTSRFTPTVAGIYQVTGSVRCDGSTTYCQAIIMKNGSGIANHYDYHTTANMAHVTTLVQMNGTTDYLELNGVSGGAAGNINGGDSNTYFEAALVGHSGGSDTLSGLSCATNEIPKWDGSAWACAADGGGGGAGTSVSFFAHSGSTAMANNTWVEIPNWTQTTDQGGDNFNPTTGKFTAPVSGTYQFNATLYIPYNVSALIVQTEGAGAGGTQICYSLPNLSGSPQALSCSGSIYLTAGTVVEVIGNQASGSSQTPAVTPRTIFSGFLVGGGADTLSALSCSAGEVPEWDGSDWVCGTGASGASGNVVTGSYTGNGAASQSINLGFRPKMVVVKGIDGTYKPIGIAIDGIPDGAAHSRIYSSNGIAADSTQPKITATGFDAFGNTNDSTFNYSGTVYHYVAIKDGGGGGAGSTAVAFEANKNGANQTVTANTWTKLTFPNEVYDIGNGFDTATSRFTPTVAGRYVVTMGAYCTGVATACSIMIYKNGVGHSMMKPSSAAENDLIPRLTTIVDMNGTTDYLEAYAYTGGTTIGGANMYTAFSAALVGGGGSDTLSGLSCSAGQVPEWDGSNWVCGTGSGGGSASTAPGFFAHANGSAMTVTAATFTKMNWTTETFDASNAFDLTNDRFTPQVAGRYVVAVQAYMPACGAGSTLEIRKNGSATIAYTPIIEAGWRGGGSTVVDLNGTTDYVEAYAYCVGGTSVDGGAAQTNFSAGLLGGGGAAGGSGTQVAFGVRKNADQTVTASSFNKMTWQVENFDTNNNFASDRFTATIAGKYIFTANAFCTNTTNNCIVALFKNGTNYVQSGDTGTAGGTGEITSIIDLGVGDYVEAYVWPGNGTTVRGMSADTHFSGALLGGGGGGGSDTLSGLSCSAGEVPEWDGSTWVCGAAGGGVNAPPVIAFSGGGTTTATLASGMTLYQNNTRDAWGAYGTLPSFLIGTKGTDTVNGTPDGSAVTLSVSGGPALCYLIRSSGWAAVPTTHWALTSNTFGSYDQIYQRVFPPGNYTLDSYSAMYACSTSPVGVGSGSLDGLSCSTGEVPQWDGSAWGCAAATASSTSTPVSFAARKTGVQPVAANTWIKVAWDAEDFDTNNNFDLTNERFQPTVPGKYQINATVYSQDVNGYLHAVVYKNGSFYAGNVGSGNNANRGTNISTVVDMNGTTDYIEIYAYVYGTGTVNVYGGGAGSNWTNFSGFLIPGADTLGALSCTTGQVPEWTGSAWACGTGTGGGTAEVSFSASGATTSLPSATWTEIVNGTQAYDNGGDNYNPATGKFTAPSDGRYFFSANMQGTYSSGLTGLLIQPEHATVNSTRACTVWNMTSTSGEVLVCSGVLSLTAGQVVEVIGYQSSGSANALAGSITNNFMGYKIAGALGSDTLSGLTCTSGQIPKWNGTTWACAADGGGGGGSGTIPSFSVNKGGTNQSVTSSVWTQLTWSTEAFDTNNNFDTGTGRFTPTVAGKYYFSLNTFCTNATTFCAAAIYKNGAVAMQTNQIGAGAFGVVNGVIDMNGTTDYVTAWGYAEGGNYINGTAAYTNFSGSLLGGGADTLSGLSCAAGEVPEWDGSTWVCGTGSGGGGAGADVAFHATATAAQTGITASTATKLVFGAETFDSGNAFVPGSGGTQSRFTPQTAGKYILNAGTLCDAGATGQYCVLEIRKNSTAVATSQGAPNSGIRAGPSASAVVDMNGTTDYAEVWVTTSGTATAYLAGAAYTYFSGALLGGGSDTLSGLSCTSGQVPEWDGSTWVCGTGSGGGGSGSAFFAHKNGTGQSVNDATVTALTFSTETFDTNNEFNTGTGKFIPTTAGKYILTAAAEIQNLTTDKYHVVYIYKNGAAIARSAAVHGSATNPASLIVTAVVDANGTTDEFDVRVYQSSGSAMTYNGAASATYFTGAALGGGGGGSDTLAGLSCTSGQVPKWSGSAWSCANDNAASTTSSYAMWNSAGPANATFSLNNMRVDATAYGSTNFKRVHANIATGTSGKYYYEIEARTAAGSGNIVAGGFDLTTNSPVQEAALGMALSTANNYSIFSGTIANGGTINLAIDIDAGKWWYGKDGVWAGSGNPATGANPAGTFTAGTSYYPATTVTVSADNVNRSGAIARFSSGAWQYPAPSGFGMIGAVNSGGGGSSASSTAFRVYRAAAYTSPSTAFKFDYDTKAYDVTSNFDLSTDQFTAPTAGRYLFTGIAAGATTGAWALRLMVNGANVAWGNYENTTTSHKTLSTVVNLAAGDVVQLWVENIAGITTWNTGQQYAAFTGTLLGGTGGGGSSQWTDVTGGINYAGGKVGVGTVSPAYPLDVTLDATKYVRVNDNDSAGYIRIGDASGAASTMSPTIWAQAAGGATRRIYFIGDVDPADDTGTDAVFHMMARQVGSTDLANRGVLAVKNNGNNLLWVAANGNVGIGTAAPAATAILDLTSTTKGFLPPRMTTTERDAIASPAEGLVVYNTTTKSLDLRVASSWLSFGGSMTGNSMVSGWPDAIRCVRTSDSAVMVWYANFLPVGTTYRYRSTINTAGDYTMDFNSSGAWTATTTPSNCDNKTIAQLYASGQAYNFVGGSSASADGSAGQVQFNEGGNLKADAALHWDNTNKRLGIGTATPLSKLHVAGTAADIAMNSGDANLVGLLSNNTRAGSRQAIYFNHDGSPAYNDLYLGSAFEVVDGVSASAATFQTAGSSFVNPAILRIGHDGFAFLTSTAATTGTAFTPTTVLRITNAGSVGIGTATPDSKLQVAGTDSSAAASSFGLNVSTNRSGANATNVVGVRSAPTVSATTGTTTYFWGLLALPTVSGASTVTNAYGAYVRVDNLGAGTITNAYGLAIPAPTNSGGGTITNNYGIYQFDATAKNVLMGSVGIGAVPGGTAADPKLQVAGAIVSTVNNAATATTINFATSNVAYTSAACGAFTLQNMADGGSYTLIVKGNGTGPATFTHAGMTVKTTGTLTCASAKHTVFSFIRAGTDVYVTMITGY